MNSHRMPATRRVIGNPAERSRRAFRMHQFTVDVTI